MSLLIYQTRPTICRCWHGSACGASRIPLGALLTSESWEKTGQVHWQVHQDGAVSLTLWNGKNYAYKSAPMFLDSQINCWVQTAVVYDHRAGLVKFYRDGQLVDTKPITKHVRLCIGRAWIGNWRLGGIPEDPRDPINTNIRNFRGRIDEMAIFRRALSNEEIQRMFEAEQAVFAHGDSGGEPTKLQDNTTREDETATPLRRNK